MDPYQSPLAAGRLSCRVMRAKGLRKALLYARQDSNLRPLAPEANALIH